MGSRGATMVMTRAQRMKTILQSTLEPTSIELADVSHQHAGHANFKGDDAETHFNLKIVSPKFDRKTLVNRHRMVYDALSDELRSGLHAISIVAKTPLEEQASAAAGASAAHS
ncbi:BolA-like family protein [Euphorbia peplus]|nr:BolA-like family protein [Euphorbia peplus]